MTNKLTFWSKWIQPVSVLDFSRGRRFRPELKDVFFRYLGLSACSKVLDVGCGPETFTRYLAKYMQPPSSPLDRRVDELLGKLRTTLSEPIERENRVGRCFRIEEAPKVLDRFGLK